MRIAIDLQGAQAGNARRGIGRYTIALAQAMLRAGRGHEFLLVLNGAFADTIEPLRATFAGLLPAENIRLWQPPAGPACGQAAERVREAFLASLAPDMVHVSSLFEGPGDAAVTSCGVFARLPTAVTLYDLIPLVRQSPYLDDAAVRAHYLRKVDHLRRADLLLAISDASRAEAIEQLGLPPGRCVTISTAADAHFRPRAPDAAAEAALRGRLGLPRPFLMYTGGIDHRKNIEGLIRAWALLPPALRQAHQLAIVCSAQPQARDALLRLARDHGLAGDELVLTGYVAEDDLVWLYNLCRAFIFPSLHEGFGLPALEAMQCGAPVIASASSSLPEVVGRADALFDPGDTNAMAHKIEQVLGDDGWRADLAAHGVRRAREFSWAATAERTLQAFEAFHLAQGTPRPAARPTRAASGRPRLAFVSPLPPERSGIADYSAELLPELARHYEIDVVIAQAEVSDAWINGCTAQRSVEWFTAHANEYDRVLYHFGNSAFHQHMFELLRRVPGVVVLHDFFLSGIQAYREAHALAPHAWSRELLQGHGYAAVARRYLDSDTNKVVFDYPCSFSVLQQASGVIVHSPHSQVLARQWYGEQAAAGWALIPLLRKPPPTQPEEREAIRHRLGIAPGDFLVCSFGLLGATKQNDRLARAWQLSALGRDKRCKLVFVGENHPSEYGRKLQQSIAASGGGRVRITGWASAETFRHYLEAADLAVQLRGLSRGETSAAVLDCMNHGLPTIVNANGSMAYLPPDAVLALPDEYSDQQLADALDSLWQEPARRAGLSRRAREVIRAEHSPAACAASYAQAIEAFDARARHGRDSLLREIAQHDALGPQAKLAVARAVARNLPPLRPARQLLVDISELVQRDAGSGIQRVVKNLLHELIAHPPEGVRIEPVYAVEGVLGYRYARRFTMRFLGCPDHAFDDEPIDYQAGDAFLGLDLQPQRVPEQAAFLDRLRLAGVHTSFVVYDLLPLLQPRHFVEGAAKGHAAWLEAAARADGLICISQAVALELQAWLDERRPDRVAAPLSVGWFHLGADVLPADKPSALSAEDQKLLARATARPSLLMVGTVEPRKGHAQALAAFEQLWDAGSAINLVIVGKPGWMVDALVQRLRSHPEQGQRLFWLERAGDALLDALYAGCGALLAASEGEGFGLPLIEAAQKRLPVIARDLPVFREVAGRHAHYFQGREPQALARAIQEWLALRERGAHPQAEAMPWLTWRQSAAQLVEVVVNGRWQAQWMPQP